MSDDLQKSAPVEKKSFADEMDESAAQAASAAEKLSSAGYSAMKEAFNRAADGQSSADGHALSGLSSEQKRQMTNSTGDGHAAGSAAEAIAGKLRDGKAGGVSDGMLEALESMKKYGQKEAVKELPTGDTLVRQGGREYLFMPNGDRLTVNGNGSFNLRANGPVDVSSKGDVTTIKYPNGDSVSFDPQGVLSVQRGQEAVNFGRYSKPAEKPYFKPDYNSNSIERSLKPVEESYNKPVKPNVLPELDFSKPRK